MNLSINDAEWHEGTESESLWSQKEEAPHVSSVIVGKTIFTRWNAIKVSLSSQIENTRALLTFHSTFLHTETKWLWHAPWSPHKGPCVKRPTCANEIHHLIRGTFWALGSFFRKDGRLNFSCIEIGHYCKEIFSVVSFVWTRSDENLSFSFCVRNHYWDCWVLDESTESLTKAQMAHLCEIYS